MPCEPWAGLDGASGAGRARRDTEAAAAGYPEMGEGAAAQQVSREAPGSVPVPEPGGPAAAQPGAPPGRPAARTSPGRPRTEPGPRGGLGRAKTAWAGPAGGCGTVGSRR